MAAPVGKRPPRPNAGEQGKKEPSGFPIIGAGGGQDVPYHVPVMLAEVLGVLNPPPGGVFVDATLGAGGHARAVAERIGPGGRVVGIDRDPEALAEAGRNLSEFGSIFVPARARFDAIGAVLKGLNLGTVNGVLFDLGVSSHQLDAPERGFSFREPDAPLDMRMDRDGDGPTAADLLNDLPERELTALLRAGADEKWAARIARFVTDRRQAMPYRTAGQLVETVLAAMPRGARPGDKHPATRTFQALRIAVNGELDILERALSSAADALAPGGVLAVLSYHSGEDRIVKQFFAERSGRGAGEGPYGTRPPATLELITRKAQEPSTGEVAANPRARSARLRAARKL